MAGVGRLVIGIVALAACSAQAGGARPSAATLNGPTAPTGSTPSSPIALRHFADHDDLIAFDYPADWHERPGGPNPSGNFAIVFVGSADLTSDCPLNLGAIGKCPSWPVTRLVSNEVIVVWRFVGLPGDSPPTGGTAIVVGGLSAFRTFGPADAGCSAIGGDESIDVTVPAIPGEYYWYSAHACLAGPDRGENEAAFSAILASTTIPMSESASP